MDEFREDILKFLKKETKLENIPLEVPPNPEMGDYAFPCFVLSKEWKKSPMDIPKELSSKFKPTKLVAEARPTGPYINFFVNKNKIAQDTLKDVLKQKNKFGSSGIGKKKKILLEHTSINPNASPHVGRARNALIGDSVARILKFQDYKVEVHYFVNDVGKQVAMLVLGAEGKKDVTFDDLLNIYIEINKKVEEKPELEKTALDLLNKLEKGDKEVRKKFDNVVKICI